jgi:hypothetical protein
MAKLGGFRSWERAIGVALHYGEQNGRKYRVRGRFNHITQEWRWHVEAAWWPANRNY